MYMYVNILMMEFRVPCWFCCVVVVSNERPARIQSKYYLGEIPARATNGQDQKTLFYIVDLMMMNRGETHLNSSLS